MLRKRHRIKVSGGSVPPPLRSFQQLQSQPGSLAGLQATLAGIGCTVPTAIQRQAVPILLAGREVLAVAPTGGTPVVNASGMGAAIPATVHCGEDSILLVDLQVLAQFICVCPCCTGSGKTLAYLLPMLLGLCGQGPGPGPRAAVMAPTRELAAQIARVLDTLLPGSGLRSSLLSSSTAAGTDFGKVAGSRSAQCSAPATAASNLLFHTAASACS